MADSRLQRSKLAHNQHKPCDALALRLAAGARLDRRQAAKGPPAPLPRAVALRLAHPRVVRAPVHDRLDLAGHEHVGEPRDDRRPALLLVRVHAAWGPQMSDLPNCRGEERTRDGRDLLADGILGMFAAFHGTIDAS